MYTCIKVYTNGYITMGGTFRRRKTRSLSKVKNSLKKKYFSRGITMLSALWTDADFSYGYLMNIVLHVYIYICIYIYIYIYIYINIICENIHIYILILLLLFPIPIN